MRTHPAFLRSIELADIEGGRVDAKSASGDVVVRGAGVQAPLDVNVESVSGDVDLTDAHGNITIKTTSGDITAARIAAVTLQAQSVSGDLSVCVSAAFSGTFTATTVSGDVSVRVPDGSNYRFALDSHTGSLECETAAVNTVHTDRMWAGTVGTGAGMLTVQTVSGDINLTNRGEA